MVVEVGVGVVEVEVGVVVGVGVVEMGVGKWRWRLGGLRLHAIECRLSLDSPKEFLCVDSENTPFVAEDLT